MCGVRGARSSVLLSPELRELSRCIPDISERVSPEIKAKSVYFRFLRSRLYSVGKVQRWWYSSVGQKRCTLQVRSRLYSYMRLKSYEASKANVVLCRCDQGCTLLVRRLFCVYIWSMLYSKAEVEHLLGRGDQICTLQVRQMYSPSGDWVVLGN